MLAYKGFNSKLQAIFGQGLYRFTPESTHEVEECKTGKNGFHCAEYILDCTSYYSIDGQNRFFIVEAAGDINENSAGHIACTKITLLQELDLKGIAVHAIKYMILHPTMAWEKQGSKLQVAAGSAETSIKGAITIARGEQPMARAAAGSIIGLLREKEPGLYTDAVVDVVGGRFFKKPDTWYTVEDGKVKEAEEIEKKTSITHKAQAG